jgi:hypothetical protein
MSISSKLCWQRVHLDVQIAERVLEPVGVFVIKVGV